MRHPFFDFLDGEEYRDDFNKKLDAIFESKKMHPRAGRWDADDPDVMDVLLQLVDTKILPELKKLDSFDEAVAFASRPENSLVPFEQQYYPRVLLAVAMGQLDVALDILERQPHVARSVNESQPSLYPALIAADRKELARVLHDTEAYMVKLLKLEKYWQPTPFPIELMSDQGVRS